jgi:3-oxoacyl-[acyl-carrier-protein] synthase-3
LHIAGSLLQNNNIKRALLLCGDTISTFLSPMDKSSSMLFGDAGSATLLEKAKGQNVNFLLKTKGAGYKSIMIPSGACRNIAGDYERKERGEGIFRNDFDLAMDGTEVFNFTISDVPRSINEFLSSTGESVDSYDWFLLHQANLFMLNHIAKKVKIPKEKLPITIDRFGNTSVASIPLTIADLYNNRIPAQQSSRKDHILLAGFGVGLSWGIIGLDIDPRVCLPIFYTDDYFSEEQVVST